LTNANSLRRLALDYASALEEVNRVSDPQNRAHISRRRFLAGSALAAGGAVTATLLSACNAGTSSSPSAGSSAAAPTAAAPAAAAQPTTAPVATTAAAATAAPAAPTAAPAAAAAKTVTLTVMYKNNELTKDHIAQFESNNPSIKISFVEFDQNRLNAMLASGSPPDFVRGGAVASSNGNARGLATSLDPYLEKSSVLKTSDLLPVNDNFRWDGKAIGQGPYYGIVKDWSQDATLWFNRALFDKAQIAPLSTTNPVSYDELMDIAKKLTVQDGGKTQVYGLGAEWAWTLYAPIAMMIMQQGAVLYNADLTTADLTTPAAKRAIQWYVDLAQSGVAPSSLDPLADGADLSTFMANRMAVTQDGFWYGGNFVKESDELKNNIRMAPAPQMGDQRISPCYAGIGAWIPAQSKNKDAAWTLMEYFMAGPPAQERAKSGWGLPALKSLLPMLPQDLPYQKDAFATSQTELTFSKALPASPYVSTDNWSTVLDKYIASAAKKEISVDDAAQQITDDINNLLKQGKDQIG
jgi:multiple sugar transport system substrate-binding protein